MTIPIQLLQIYAVRVRTICASSACKCTQLSKQVPRTNVRSLAESAYKSTRNLFMYLIRLVRSTRSLNSLIRLRPNQTRKTRSTKGIGPLSPALRERSEAQKPRFVRRGLQERQRNRKASNVKGKWASRGKAAALPASHECAVEPAQPLRRSRALAR